MLHLIFYKTDSLEPPHPLSPLPQGGEGRSNSNQSPLPLSREANPALRGRVGEFLISAHPASIVKT